MNELARGELSAREKAARLRLALTQHVGPITFRQLLERYGSAEGALKALPELASKGGLRGRLKVFPEAGADEAFEAVQKLGGYFIFLGEAVYPEPLAALEDAPAFLVAKGNPHFLGKNALAIVGARNASANGRKMAETIARALGQSGLVIVSGLARGIDGAAHAGALETGTVAVLGGGLDVYYPTENRELQEAIAERGLVLSEHLPGAVPQAQNFPRRNRIISGLSLGVVVVEAALRSGSLITARFALEQGRDVFAVPGHPMDPRAKGTNSLIRSSALLVESAEDILEALATRLRTPLSDPGRTRFDRPPPAPPDDAALAGARETIRELLGHAPTPVDELIRLSQQPPAAVLTVLLEMELAGLVARHPGNRVSLA